MNKKLLIGGAAIAAAGAIGIGAFMMSGDGSLRVGNEPNDNTIAEDKEKIEQLYWDELKDKDKYSFCLGEANISAKYTDPILNSDGALTHNSTELLLYKKEENKFYLISRQIEYNYGGTFSTQFAGLSTVVPVTESGKLSEYYAKNEMPMRLDYDANYIATDPDTKKKNWVYSVMGEETEMVNSRTGCPGVFTLNNTPGNDLLVGGEQIIIERACSMKDMVGSYSGNFSYNCQALDYNSALEMAETAKLKAQLEEAKVIDVDSSETGEDAGVETSAGGEYRQSGGLLIDEEEEE